MACGSQCFLTFISMINFMLSRVEHEKGFITSLPGLKSRRQISYHVQFVVEAIRSIVFPGPLKIQRNHQSRLNIRLCITWTRQSN